MSPSGGEGTQRSRKVTDPSQHPGDVKGVSGDPLARAADMLLRHHGAPLNIRRSAGGQIEEYLRNSVDEADYVKRAKYLTLTFMSDYLDNESPEAPASGVFCFKGKAWRWVRQRLHCFSRKNTHLWFSWLNLKRSAAPVTSDIVLSNFQKHRAQMESPDPLDNEDGDAIIDQILSELRPVIASITKAISTEVSQYFTHPEPFHKASESASIESSRKMGGAVGHLRRLLNVEDHLRSRPSMFGMKESHGSWLDGRKVVVDPIQTITFHSEEMDNLHEMVRQKISEFDSVKILDARVEAVLEPLKVRTISKGQTLEYYIAKPIQQAIHGAMREMPAFRLIGRPLCPTDLMDLNRRTSDDELQWNSIDYSAATDGLSARLSQEILSSILAPFAFKNLRLYNLLLSVLAPHRISYPPLQTSMGKVQLDPVVQRNGQLMGSILSFPILCLANAGLYLAVRRHFEPKLSKKRALQQVLVNGDDMLYRGTKAEWDYHAELGDKIGLRFSPGKAYRHPVYANINSTSLHHEANGTPYLVKFLNLGLFYGQHKVLGKMGTLDEEKVRSPYISVMNEVVGGALPGKEADIFKQYISLHSQAISKEASGRNLFISPALGGFGVIRPDGISTNITASQRTLMSRLVAKLPLWPVEGVFPRGRLVRKLIEHIRDPVRLTPELDQRVRSLKPDENLMDTRLAEVPWVLFCKY